MTAKDHVIAAIRKSHPEPVSGVKFRDIPVEEFERDDILRLFAIAARKWRETQEQMTRDYDNLAKLKIGCFTIEPVKVAEDVVAR